MSEQKICIICVHVCVCCAYLCVLMSGTTYMCCLCLNVCSGKVTKSSGVYKMFRNKRLTDAQMPFVLPVLGVIFLLSETS